VKEFELIERLIGGLPGNTQVVVGAGDDCAVLRWPDPAREIVFKTDAVVEGVHFTSETAPERIGHKALARCLSDFAAMSATPVAAVITLATKGIDAERIERIYTGINALAKRYAVAVVGGETTSMPSGLLVNVAAIGSVESGKAILRSGAKVGDALFVTGELGGSIEGKHLDFEPRLAEAQWLAENFHLRSMIDLSDGLAGDLRQILKASSVPGAELLGSALPISRVARIRAKQGDLAKPAMAAALTDGEDFELLFSVAPSNAVKLLDAWRVQFPKTKLSCIGRLVDRPGIWLRDATGMRPVNASGFDHFSDSGQGNP
jgi:thiamine-monophosphate kinase